MPIIACKVGKGRNQQLILVESTGRGNVPRNASGALLKRAAEKLETHLSSVSGLAETLRTSLQNLNHPSKVAVEFGLEVDLEVGIPMVTKGTTRGNFKVTIEWENPK